MWHSPRRRRLVGAEYRNLGFGIISSIINATIGAVVLGYSSSGWFEVDAGATAPELVRAAVGVSLVAATPKRLRWTRKTGQVAKRDSCP